MRELNIIIFLFLSVFSYSQSTYPKDSIKEFVNFLSNDKKLSPKEYIFKLYEQNDIIIISERHHADLTQYEFIINILKDKRFKGNIFTEVGVFNSYKPINQFLLKSSLSKQEKKEELLNLYRDVDFNVIWEKYNFYHLLSSIYDINQKRDENEKILLFPLDIKFDWKSIQNYQQYEMFDSFLEKNVIDRDYNMGKHFVTAYEYLKNKNPSRNKALVILNSYHGYTRIPTYLPLPTKPDIYSAAEFIYKTYPNTTKSVLINTYNYTKKELVAGGKWDAAFKMTENKNVGFDFKNSPFGKTIFDLYNFGGSDFSTVNFEYIFDGFVFYKPINEFILAWGIPDIYTGKYTEQFYKRISLTEGISLEKARTEENIEWLKKINELKYTKIRDLDLYNKQIKNWINNNNR